MSPREVAARQEDAVIIRPDFSGHAKPAEPARLSETQSEPVAAPASPVAPAPAAFVPKSPAMTVAYIVAGTLIALTQGLGLSFISTNLQQIAGPMSLTQVETTWLMAAYLFPNASLTLLLFKVRAQYGLRNFAEVAVVAYVLVCLAHFWVDSYHSALVLRFFAGVAAAPMTSLGFLYILEAIPPARKMNIGLCIALTALAIPAPITGLISPTLLDLGDYHALYVVEMGLAMVSLGLVYLLPLNSPPRAKVISSLDVVSYIFLAIALGCFAVVLTVGRLYWWTATDWLALPIIAGIIASAIFAMIELNRRNHLVDIRWLTSREILHFTGALLVFRIALSEQSSGAINFLRNAGMLNEQMAGLYWVILAGSIVSGIVCAAIMKPGRASAIHAVSLLFVAIGSYMDSRSTTLTRPEQMYVSQFLVSFASGLFLPPALAVGMGAALKRGPSYILSFIVVFLATQKIGGYLGSALYGTFVQWREQFHSFRLVSQLTSTDPLVAARLKQLGGAYGKVLTDPNQQTVQGTALLARQVQQQAYALAYNDSFLLTAYLSLAAFGCLCVHVAWRNREHFLPNSNPMPAAA
ncbi:MULTISPECIES: MFS transporter [Rhizobium/Agrobacterium group]|uniref:MFS transporter n=1 Tax=Neorhizobium petrolearium TaxID=515361 RepID=A0ABY8MBF7_9HYPH|nr:MULTISPECIES: MFS transporter [Rhizobium/Agrobacterium group]KGE02367.1 MFS transporter [Rhizobium sp. YS-1r]MCC2613477.1 MFS transporter [Neorhizobium petrolearium]WGI71802.1 MFS transporter [Neorhizobium petrolearium]